MGSELHAGLREDLDGQVVGGLDLGRRTQEQDVVYVSEIANASDAGVDEVVEGEVGNEDGEGAALGDPPVCGSSGGCLEASVVEVAGKVSA